MVGKECDGVGCWGRISGLKGVLGERSRMIGMEKIGFR